MLISLSIFSLISINITMSERYKTLDVLTLFQNQSSHYRKVLNPKRDLIVSNNN